jgi:sarcosine oxidase subunit alpha
MNRVRPPIDPITIELDGRRLVAGHGEPAAVALVAEGYSVLARSPKFHRPRGPTCLRAACDGCLARVNGVPNVMTCRVPAAEGMRIETQNVVGSRDVDLFRMADWFFPEGMNHHELFAGVPGVERVMQAFARRVAGLGRLPTESGHPRPREASRRDVDVLVVGTGPAGMASAIELAARGRRVEILEDDLDWGGNLRAMPGESGRPWGWMLDAFSAELRTSRVCLRLQTTAAGIYDRDVLVAHERGVEVVTARTVVLAPGAHDGVIAFEGNDVPGVMSARAGCRLLAHGVAPGRQVVVVVTKDGGPFGEAFARACPSATVLPGVPVRVRGAARVKNVTVRADTGDRELACDALLVDAPRAPAYELCAQAGAELKHEPTGFAVRTGPCGMVCPGVFAIGEVAGTPFEPGAITSAAKAMADCA